MSRPLSRLLLIASALLLAVLLAAPPEVLARGRGHRGGGGGGFSRGGAARGGSIGGYERSRGARGGASGWGSRSGSAEPARRSGETSPTWSEGSRSREGSFETRRGETVDWNTTVTRDEDGLSREGSWESTSGASGSRSSRVRVEDGQVQSVERSREVTTAGGETVERRGSIERTDGGFVAQGGIAGEQGAAGRTVVKDGDDVYVGRAATDGDGVVAGGAHCRDGRCTGGRVYVDYDDYDDYPYYWAPYYYGWYSCPAGSVQTWSSRYGTPIYGCSNVTVIHTTISLGEGGGSGVSGEARVSSAPVLMYEVTPEVVAYATPWAPQQVHARKQGDRFLWVPGPKEADAEVDAWLEEAAALKEPSANGTVITYAIDSDLVYLTDERPAPGFYSEKSDQLFVWIPGVREPSGAELDAILATVNAQQSGGQAALDREARKLEEGREPPQVVAKP